MHDYNFDQAVKRLEESDAELFNRILIESGRTEHTLPLSKIKKVITENASHSAKTSEELIASTLTGMILPVEDILPIMINNSLIQKIEEQNTWYYAKVAYRLIDEEKDGRHDECIYVDYAVIKGKTAYMVPWYEDDAIIEVPVEQVRVVDKLNQRFPKGGNTAGARKVRKYLNI